MNKKCVAIMAMFLLIVTCVFGCGLSGAQPEAHTESEFEKLLASDSHPYLSITYGRNNPKNMTGREIAYYTYDLVTGKLKEECVLPYDADYACGVVSKAKNTVYYASRANPNDLSSNDSLWAYNIETKETVLLEAETNRSYNSITLMGKDRLLVMAATREHPVQPAVFDLGTNTFTYLSDVNGEPRELYTCGPSRMSYNYKTHEIVFLYQNEAETHSSEYMHVDKPADVFLTTASEGLVKAAEPVWSKSFLLKDEVTAVTRLSENEFWIVMCHYNMDAENESDFYNNGLYSLKFEDGETTMTPIDFPCKKFGSLDTADGGETFFLLMNTLELPERSLYSYCPKTKEICLILPGEPEKGGHVVNYSIMGPES